MSDHRMLEVQRRPVQEVVRIAAILALLVLCVFGVAYLVSPSSRRAITQARCLTGGVLTHTYNQVAPNDSQSGKNHSAATTTLVQSSVEKQDNLLANTGAETLKNSNLPLFWNHAAPATLSANFSLVSGHDSRRAMRVEVSNYQSGNADWYSDRVDAVSGQYYEFSDWYRSDSQTTTVLSYVDAKGQELFTDLGSTIASKDWRSFTIRFFAPKDATSLAVYHVLGGNGFLETDDYSLKPATPQNLIRGLVSITFDDGWRTSYTQALPIMKRLNLVSTQFIISGFVGAPAYLKPSQLYAFQDAGHEVASHSVRHPDLTTLDEPKIDDELLTSKDQLSNCFGESKSYASPYGSYNDTVLAEAKKFYSSYRSTDRGFNTKDQFDPYHVVVQNVEANTPSDTVTEWVDVARANRSWLVLVYHQIDKSGSLYSRTPQAFEADMKAIKSAQISTKTYSQAFAEVQDQIK